MNRFLPTICLLGMGLAWGLSMPMTKLAVSTGHEHFGILIWQMVLVAILMGIPLALRPRTNGPRLRHLRLLLFVAFFGTMVPNSLSYIAAGELPSGVMAIIMSLIPMFSLPIALIWRLEVFEWKRLGGLIFGAVAMFVLIAPGTSLPNPSAAPFVLFAVVATICYGLEGNYVAKFGLDGLDTIQVVFYSSLLGLLIIIPTALVTDQYYNPFASFGVPEYALIVASLGHGFAYACLLWLIGRTGPVFAAQVSYIVTVAGVAFSIFLLRESYSGYIWLALALVMIGLFLVQPKVQSVEQG